MLKKFGRFGKHAAAFGAVAVLVAVAAATDFLENLFIMAPVDVVAGNPIHGYVTGMEDPCYINARYTIDTPEGPQQVFLGPQVMGMLEPLYFSYPTFEPMAPGFVIITARDSDEEVSKSVFLK